jgi:cold shock CspA family protein
LSDVFFGTVKFFNNERDFGFVVRDDNAGAADVFVGAEGRGLHAGDHVQFEIELGRDKRQRAVNVKVRRAANEGLGAAARRDDVWRHDGII